MSGSEGDKTEAATPKKRDDAAKKGDLLRSRDLGAAAVAAGFIGWAALGGQGAYDASRALLRNALTLDRADITAFEPQGAAVMMLGTLALPFATLGGVLFVAAVASGLVLGGHWQGGAMGPRWSRLDPAAGLKRMFGGEAFTGLMMAVLKVGAGLGLAAWAALAWFDEVVGLAAYPLKAWVAPSASLLWRTVLLFGVLTIVVAGLDVFVQWRRREARLRMTKHDVREEMKSNEGSPERKRAQRERQYAIASRSARKAMAEATVVLTNPTHFAVAIRYRPGLDGVPIVVARGTDEAARAIRDLADEHDVPKLESALLARAIYFSSKVGEPVVGDLYLAVATVLAFVFDLDAMLARGKRSPDVVVPDTLRFGADGKLTT